MNPDANSKPARDAIVDAMLNWLNSNAGAVQAVCAVLLIVVTWYYVRLTKLIAETSNRQLSAILQPVLQVVGFDTLYGTTDVDGVTHYYSISGTVKVINLGTSPLKLRRMYLVAEHRGEWEEYPIDDHDGLVLTPKGNFAGYYSVKTDCDYSSLDSVVFNMRVECTDLSGIFLHSFFHHPGYGTQHYAERVVGPTAWHAIKRTTLRIWKRLNWWAKEKRIKMRFLKGYASSSVEYS